MEAVRGEKIPEGGNGGYSALSLVPSLVPRRSLLAHTTWREIS